MPIKKEGKLDDASDCTPAAAPAVPDFTPAAPEMCAQFVDLERRMADFLDNYAQLKGDYECRWRSRKDPVIEQVMKTSSDLAAHLIEEYNALAQALAKDDARFEAFFRDVGEYVQREVDVD